MRKFDFDGTSIANIDNAKALIMVNTSYSFPVIYSQRHDTEQLNLDTNLRSGTARMLATEIRTHSPTEEESEFSDQLTEFANNYRSIQVQDDSLEQRDHLADSVESLTCQLAEGLIHHTLNPRYLNTIKNHHRRQFSPTC